MSETYSVSSPIEGSSKVLSFETGKFAMQADGAVVARIGDTVVLVTATASKTVREGIDFFPLTVDIEERMYAAGKIPGSFFRREGRATDQAILTSRLIDRPLRPCFPDGFRNDVHVVGTILGADLENPHDVIAINAASCALLISGIPFEGPVGAVRIAWTEEGAWLAHPTYQEGDRSTFELVVAGRLTADQSDVAILMVEAGGTESAWSSYGGGAPFATEDVIATGLEYAKSWIKRSIESQYELKAKAPAKEPLVWNVQNDYSDALYAKATELGWARLAEANSIAQKSERQSAIDAASNEVLAALVEEFPDEANKAKAALKSVLKKVIRHRIIHDKVRIDGRDTTTIRPLLIEVGLIPTAHGSGLFQRGETQVLNVCTLGMPKMNQLIDTIGIDESKRYMHHYNFPPFSVGEAGQMRGPKRREIGHGLLAERALLPVIPPSTEFPYTLRLVSEVLSSNGSTSMASVCGSTLSLMDAGVPIKAPVAGIAMGLVFEDGEYVTLTDILGAEDAFGDMDFKVAGTRDFVTALQLDTKIDGIPADVLASALSQAKTARLEILEAMEKVISEPREEVRSNAPKILTFEVPLDKIGEIIGPKGKNINSLQQETGADVTIEDQGGIGIVTIGAKELSAALEAKARIDEILDPPIAEVGATYMGRVVNITKFGAFVNIMPSRDGLLHISKIGGGKRVDRVEDVLSLNQQIEVVVEEIDPSGKLSLRLASDVSQGEAQGDSHANAAESRPSREFRAETSHAPSRSEAPAERQERPKRAQAERVSFEEAFEAELVEEFGDLGPALPQRDNSERRGYSSGSRDRGPRRNPRR